MRALILSSVFAASALVLQGTSAHADQAFLYSLRTSHCSHAPASRMLTGFRLAGTKGVVTALHGVVDCPNIQATNRSGPALPGTLRVYDVDVAHDVARLSSDELEAEPAKGLPPAAQEQISAGTRAIAVGYPLSTDLEDSAIPVTIGNPALRTLGDMLNTATRQSLIDSGSPDISSRALFIVGFISPGDSGAPVINEKAQVLGIVSGGLGQGSGISWAFPPWLIHWTAAAQAPALAALRSHSPMGLYYAATDGPNLEISIMKAEHTFFYLYGPPQAQKASLPDKTPAFSMLQSSDGYNVDYFVTDPYLTLQTNSHWDSWMGPNEEFFQKQPVNSQQQGMTITTFKTTIHPKAIVLPEGEVVVDFLVGNTGSSAVTLDGVFIDIISRKDLPPSIAGEFLPAFKMYKDVAVLRSDTPSYRMLNEEVMSYDPGQKDIYRFSVRVADSEGSGLFSCQLRVTYSINGHASEIKSEPFWVAKYFGGTTNRNVYAKFHSDEAPTTTLPYGLRHVDGIDSVHRSPRYTTHTQLADIFRNGSDTYQIPGIRPDRTKDALFANILGPTKHTLTPLPWPEGGSYDYAMKHLATDLIGKTRTPVQKFGFTVDDAIAPSAMMERFDQHSYQTGDSKEYSSYKNELPAAGSKKQVMEIYRSNSTPEYAALELAAGETVITGKANEVEALSDALVRESAQTIDAAAKVDLIALLAIVNTPASLDRIAAFLHDDNPVVQHAAAEVFEDYRWPNAAPQLWQLTNSPIPYLQRAAKWGLQMCATDHEAELLKEKILDSQTKTEEIDELCRMLIQVSPALAETVLKDPKTPDKVRSVLIQVTAG